MITVDGKRYRAHRLAWLYVYGAWPLGRLDHEDTDRQNNRIKNLRPASNAENLHNRGKQKNNTSGYKSVSWHKRQRGGLQKLQMVRTTFRLLRYARGSACSLLQSRRGTA